MLTRVGAWKPCCIATMWLDGACTWRCLGVLCVLSRHWLVVALGGAVRNMQWCLGVTLQTTDVGGFMSPPFLVLFSPLLSPLAPPPCPFLEEEGAGAE